MEMFKNVVGKILFIAIAIAFVFSQESLRYTDSATALSSGSNTAALAKIPWINQKKHQGEPFGGRIIKREECTCEPPHYIVQINDYVTKGNIWLKVEKPKSTIYEYGQNLTPNKFTLGTYDKNATCNQRKGDRCIPKKVNGVINSGPGAGVSN